jgi:transposase
MLSQAQRTTILELNAQQVSKREIARVLGISRVAVRKVLRSNSTTVPELQRPEKAEPYRQQILELFDQCKGTSCESMKNWWPQARRCRMPR